MVFLIGFWAAAPLAAAPIANAFNDRLQRLDPVMRLAIIRQSIEDNGGQCAHAIGAAYRGPFRNLERWDAACDRGGNYALFVGPDGTAQVRPCGDLATLHLPICRAVPIKR